MTASALEWSDRDQRINRTLMRAMAVSAAAHIILFAAVTVAGSFIEEPRFNEKSMQVRLLAPPQRPAKKGSPTNTAAPKKPAKPVLPPKPKPKKIPKPELKPEPKPKPKKPVIDNKKPAKKPKPKKPKPKKFEPEKEEQIPPPDPLTHEQQEDIEIARAMIRGPVGRQTGSLKGAEWSDAMAGLEGDIKLMNYQVGAGQALAELWHVPMSVPARAGLEVKVIIRVDQFGNVLNYEIIELSGNIELDQSVKRLLERAEKVPEPEFTIQGYLDIPLIFTPGEE